MKLIIIMVVFFLSVFANGETGEGTQPIDNLLKAHCSSTIVVSPNAYSQNVNKIFGDFETMIDTGLLFTYVGYGPNPGDAAHGTYTCQPRYEGEARNIEACKRCVSSARQIMVSCPGNEAIAWFVGCTVRFANRNIFKILQTQPAYWYQSENTYKPPSSFDRSAEIISTAIAQAVRDTDYAYGFRSVEVDNIGTWYTAIAQCSVDIAGTPCNDCLNQAVSEANTCCNKGRAQGVVMLPSCTLLFGYSVKTPSSNDQDGNTQARAMPRFLPESDDTPIAVAPASSVTNITTPIPDPSKTKSGGVMLNFKHSIKFVGLAIALAMFIAAI